MPQRMLSLKATATNQMFPTMKAITPTTASNQPSVCL